ncbi:MAG TPA: hypothetical protein VGO75_05795, partial [Gemmatimonadaceae bacterium]|nr:hypothetical protein [Gemmatimonadaceae bacterium]
MTTSRFRGALCALVIVGAPALARAQSSDTAVTDTTTERLGLWARTSRGSSLLVSSGKTYNRVEGLPVYIGPSFHDSAGAAEFNLSVLGIIRSANTFHWDDQNLGHRIKADMRVGRGRGYALGVSSYDVVTPVETWHLPDPDAGLAAFFIRRDFRDYFNRHGAKATATFNMSTRSSLSVDWSDERWTPVEARRVFSVFRNGSPWRANPVVDAGRFHLAVARANIDTRNDEINPSTGWLILAEYEHGSGRVTDAGAASLLARPAPPSRLNYSRMLVDLRRYNRLSPTSWINGRLVLGGWLQGDQLPLERRFSVGGLG